ncbi:unnamed protein product [Brachionus calyciflorus]|uniref:PRORP domain-containing protein n=1 Tax=Brachionus calyciflorus TaxID=104777 RepID=A0A813ZAS6_9BILA|nr:unnamed protein product [Brachionus calyciflorus]
MANLLKNFLKIRLKPYSSILTHKKFRSSENIPFKSETISQLKDKDYDDLWSKTQPKLTTTNSNVSFTEFKSVIDQVYSMVDFWKNKDGNIKNLHFKLLAKNFFSSPDNEIGKKFAANPSTWSLIFENISNLSQLIDNTPDAIRNKDNNLKDYLDIYLMESIYKFQDDKITLINGIEELTSANFYLEKLKFYAELSHSLHTYLSTTNIGPNKNQETVSLYWMRIVLLMVDTFLFMKKASLKYIIENNESEIKDYLYKMEPIIKDLMKNYQNFDSLPEFKKLDFFKIFSYYESKWLGTINWLLNTNKTEWSNSVFQYYISVLKGCIRLEKYDYFEKLMYNVHQLTIDLNIYSMGLAQYDFVFRDFMNTHLVTSNINLENNLHILLNVWSKISYIPDRNGFRNFEIFLERINKNLTNSKYLVKEVQVDLLGNVYNSKYSIQKSKFKEKDSQKIAELIKQKLLSHESLKNEKLSDFAKIDEIIDNEEIDLVVDGMNIAYLSGYDRFQNITQLLNLLNKRYKNKTFLVLLRDHVYNKNTGFIKKFERSKENLIIFFSIDSLYEDDKFCLYAAFKSRNDPMLVSNDYYANQSHFLNEYGGVFREWLFNRKISVDKSLRRIFLPPMYILKCNRINENKWLLPVVNDANNPRNHTFYQIEKKIF